MFFLNNLKTCMLRFLVALIMAFILYVPFATAMDVSATVWRGHEAILATGPIVDGDAAKLYEALSASPSLATGHKLLLLDSPGGSVSEALTVSALFDVLSVHSIVPNGASCASACASIVFVGSTLRTIEEGGMLGQHSCSRNGVANQACNNMLAKHALENGVAQGTVGAFVNFAPPEEMVWFDRAASDCFGITRYSHTFESDFEWSDPCVVMAIAGHFPQAQSKWRVDFHDGGYKAFVRPLIDHNRLLQLNLFCDENRPAQLFLGVELPGPPGPLEYMIEMFSLNADPVRLSTATFDTQELDGGYSQAYITIPTELVVDFLKRSNRLRVDLKMAPGLEPVSVTTYLSESRKALLFAANHCSNNVLVDQ